MSFLEHLLNVGEEKEYKEAAQQTKPTYYLIYCPELSEYTLSYFKAVSVDLIHPSSLLVELSQDLWSNVGRPSSSWPSYSLDCTKIVLYSLPDDILTTLKTKFIEELL